jgi:hypothetical protein
MQKALVIFGSLLVVSVPALVAAHGFGQRIDLPVPLYLYLFGGGALVALSFILLGLMPSRMGEVLRAYPKYDLAQFVWFRALASKTALLPLKLLFVVLLVVAVASGLFGEENAAFNMLPTVVWILFAIGVTFVSAFLGNVWSVVNPFKTLYEYGEAALKKAGVVWEREALPAWLGIWTALALFFAFRWIENVSLLSSEPRALSLFVLIYGTITFSGMALYGKDEWLKKGDPFSVFFSFLSRFSVTEAGEDGRVYIRPPGVGLLNQSATSVSEVAFVLFMLSSVAADGVLATPLFQDVFRALLGFGLPWFFVGTMGLFGLFVAFIAAYYSFSYLTKIVSGDASPVLDVAKRYIFSLLPIAIAYEVAHYVSILVIEGQRLFYLISDPFGWGWNLFGTAQYEINYTALNLKMLWNVQVGLIVIGHVVAVIIAHAIAERFFKDRRRALISQYPMLVLMIFYSCLSLWIMAQPIVAVK